MKKKKQKVLAIVLALVMCLQYFVPITALAAKKVEVIHKEINGTNGIGYPGTFGKAQKVYVARIKKWGFVYSQVYRLQMELILKLRQEV